MTRQIGIAPLSVLGNEPVDFIKAAAAVGYDFVGLRTRPVTATEKDLNLLPGSARLKEVQAVLKDTGMKVVDTEFIGMGADCNRDFWLPMLESAAMLGAKTLTVTLTDPDLARGMATLSRLVEDAKPFGITITLEPISYQTVKQLQEGAVVAKEIGCKVLFDTLHFHRALCGLEQITAAQPYLANMIQLCDGIMADRAATREGLIEESRSLRYVPGEGDFKLAECVALLPEDMPVSIEVPNPKFAELGLEGWLRYLKNATEQVLAKAESLR
ncbi:sugar phosphate isomerase/epimerase family protein [Neisseria perflava]|uniref:sugar phosphate isomerase/epimerase family protein n=1 Tax=Neisseria perflava TaxID=33053 RepID=UPI0020A0B142|nr:sugar phosphate isomerase/epimerase [Neisseria perflava]MCP1660438.1 sugar phosphate isomerase/epimerase [Neisseria perflava]MCP1772120.1 sugar phosphate isomerase/epimerase [Neisseria perflava]